MVRRHIRFSAVSMVLGLALVAGTGCVSDKAVVDQADQFDTNIKGAELTDPQLSDYLQSIGDRIIAAAREADSQGKGPKTHQKEDSAWMFSKEMRFHFVNSKTVNAFTTGGEHMYVYTALFEMCKSEDELAAVMSHEFAHVYSRHVQKGMKRQYGALAGAVAAGGAGYALGGSDNGVQNAEMFGGAALVAGQLLNTTFTRGDEAEADEWGYYFYTHAGWDPAKFGDFFQHMIDAGYDKGPSFLSDHPALKDRVTAAKKRTSDLGPDARAWERPDVAGAQQFASLQRRAVQVSASIPTSEDLQKTQTLLAALPRSCLTPAIQQDQIDAQAKIKKDLEEQEKKARAATRPAGGK